MLRWLAKTMWMQKLSLLASAGGIAGALVLVVILDAVFVGESNQVVAYVRNSDADVWVMQGGVANMHMASSYVWDWKVDRIAELPGVERATPILYTGTVVKAGHLDWLAFAVGLRPGGRRAGPWAMAAGEAVPEAGEIVVPRVFAEIAHIGLGDEVTITGKAFEVVGLSEGTFSMGNSVVFMSYADIEDLLSATGTVSYVLIDAKPGQDPYELSERIEREVDKVNALPQQEFIENDFQLAMRMGVEIIAFMTVIGSALAALIVAFTAYSQVARRRRELAVAKALGARNASIYLAVIVQTTVITAAGLVIAVIAALGLLPLLSAAVPQITLDVTAPALIRAAAIAAVVAVLAALVPARTVTRVDPMTVFSS